MPNYAKKEEGVIVNVSPHYGHTVEHFEFEITLRATRQGQCIGCPSKPERIVILKAQMDVDVPDKRKQRGMVVALPYNRSGVSYNVYDGCQTECQ